MRGFCPAEAPGTAHCSLGQRDARGIWGFCAAPTAGCQQQLPPGSHSAGTDTRGAVRSPGASLHSSICPVAWRGAGITFTFKLSLLQLEPVGLQRSWHSQGGPWTLLGAERGVGAPPAQAPPHLPCHHFPWVPHSAGALPPPPCAQSWWPGTPFPVAV